MSKKPELAERLMELPRGNQTFLDQLSPERRAELLRVREYYQAGRYDGIPLVKIWEMCCESLSLKAGLSTFKTFIRSKQNAETSQGSGKPRRQSGARS